MKNDTKNFSNGKTNVQKFARSVQFEKRAVWPCPSAGAAVGGPDLGKVAPEAAGCW